MRAPRRNVAVTVLCSAVLLTACPVAQSPTEIVRFDADVVSIQRGQAVRLSWDVRYPGSDASVSSAGSPRGRWAAPTQGAFSMPSSGSTMPTGHDASRRGHALTRAVICPGMLRIESQELAKPCSARNHEGGVRESHWLSLGLRCGCDGSG